MERTCVRNTRTACAWPRILFRETTLDQIIDYVTLKISMELPEKNTSTKRIKNNNKKTKTKTKTYKDMNFYPVKKNNSKSILFE